LSANLSDVFIILRHLYQ